MKILKGEIVRNDEVLKEAQMRYKDTQGFFVALVNICEQLDVDIPIWTSVEDKKLAKQGKVLIPEGKNKFLRICTEAME